MSVAALLLVGCEMPSSNAVRPDIQPGEVERIRISALTEFVPVPSSPEKVQIKTLIEFFDPLNTPLKPAFTVRFELYEFRPLSSNPRGQRVAIWPEQDLLDPVKNDEHWEDFLRGYEFYWPLKFVPQPGNKYLFEVSCSVGQRRYNDLFKMQYRP